MAYLATTTSATTTTPSSSSSSNINNNSNSSNGNNNNSIYQHHHHHHHHQHQQHHHHNHHHSNFNSVGNHNNSIGNNNSGLPNHFIEERQDVIFRKVRGILNKITPETFDKLSKELVNVGLDSPRTLRGVIYLLFDKALKDLKYSSLYAKLCQELSEKARNFEQEPGPNTFCKFLISKCEDEFERRRKATEDFDSKNELTDEEYEQKAIVKQKMLGNIKFICELGKKRLLQEEILHECIRGLLSKKKERPIQDQAQDLECLCQIMRTIGSLLDIQASRNLMNQYFERIDMFSKKPELPSRIRFMLKDVIDLRNNNWRPRPFQREDNVPQTLSKLREEAGFHDTSNSTTVDKFGNNRNILSLGDLSKMHGNKLSMLLDDEPSFTTSSDFHWGPSFLPMDQAFDAFSSPPKNANSNSELKRNQNSTATDATVSSNANLSSSSSSNSASMHQVQKSHHPFQHNDPFRQKDLGDVKKPLMNNTALNKHNNGENHRSYEGTAFEKTPFPDTKIINSRNDREPSLATNNARNIALPPRMQQQYHNQQQQRHDLPFNGVPRRFDGPRQNHAPRPVGGAVSPPTRPQIRPNIAAGTHHPPPPQSPTTRSSQPNPNYHFSRGLHGEVSDRREPRKFYPPHENQQSRHPDNVNFHNQERNFRQIGRNTQFETAQSAESDRVPNWRRALPNIATGNNNNNNVASKEHHQQQQQQLPQNPTPLLPKPPIKVSDPNFSLRPSHNLAGSRTTAISGSIQSAKSITRVDSAASDIAQLKDGKHEQLSNVVRFQPEVSQQNNARQSNDADTETQPDGSNGNSPTRTQAIELNVKKFMSILSDSADESSNVSRIAMKVKEMKIPKNCQHECLVGAMKHSILGTENDRENVGKLFVQLIPAVFEAASMLNAFKTIFEQMKALEVETPKVKSLVAGFLSQAISDGLLTLEEVGGVLSGGKHHPLFLLVLQKLEKSAGQVWLNTKFIGSKINLMDMLPEIDRSKDRLASVLKDRGLGFLDPMLTIEPDLWEQMKERDPSPAGVYRWIKDNVDQTIQSAPSFAHVLLTCLLKYIHHTAIERSKTTQSETQKKENGASQSTKSSPSMTTQNTSDIEKELLSKYQQVLQAILKEKQMQLATLYALQSFYHGLDFPKGSLLRWFHMLYDMNIVDDDVFFIWKEEINDEFPGKGQALFQVNTWLNWLAEAESEEEEDV